VPTECALHVRQFTVKGEEGSLRHYTLVLVFPLVCPPIKPQNQSRDAIKLPSLSFLAAFILPSINRLLQEGCYNVYRGDFWFGVPFTVSMT
jgi:hypothetical protein